MYLIYYISILSNAISAIVKKSNLMYYIMLLILWILYFGNTVNSDINAYKEIYYNSYIDIEIGYRFIVEISKRLNISYEGFIFLISLICFVLIFTTLKKFTTNKNLIISLYAVYPFAFDVIQVRNFIGVSILIYSIRFLIEDKKWYGIYYIIAILIASSFQIIMICYMILIIVKMKRKNTLIFMILMTTFGLSFLMFIDRDVFSNLIISLVDGIINESKIEAYFGFNSKYGFIIIWIYTFLYFMSVNLSKNILKKNLLLNEVNNQYISKKSIDFVNLVYMINIICLVFLPMYMIDITFYRLIRNLSLLNYTVYSITIESYVVSNNKLDKMKYMIIVLILLLPILVYDVIIDYNRILKPILYNNILL